MPRRSLAAAALLASASLAPSAASGAPRATLGTLGPAAAQEGNLPRVREASADKLGETTGVAAVLTSTQLGFLDPGALVGKVEDLGKCVIDPVIGLPKDPSNVVTGPAEAVGCAAGEVAGAAGQAASGVIADAAGGIADEWTKSVLEGTSWLLRRVAGAIDRSTTPNVDAAWFRGAYATMGAVALLLATPLLFFSLASALVRRDAGQAIRSACINLPMALVLSASALTLAQFGIAVTDWASAAVATTVKEPGGHFLAATSKAVAYDSLVGGGHGLPTFVALGAGLLAFVCGVVVWIEFVVRDAAVYLCSFFLPLAFAGSVWPRTARASRRVVSLLAAVVFSKFIIVAVLSLAGRAAFAGTSDEGIEPLLAAIAMLLLAVAAPATLVALIPLLDDDGGHDGLRRGVSQAVMRLPVPGPREVMRNVARDQSSRQSTGVVAGGGALGAVAAGLSPAASRTSGARSSGPATGAVSGGPQPGAPVSRPPAAAAEQAVGRVVDVAEGRGAMSAPLRSGSSPAGQGPPVGSSQAIAAAEQRPAPGEEHRADPGRPAVTSGGGPPQPARMAPPPPPDATPPGRPPSARPDHWTPEPPS